MAGGIRDDNELKAWVPGGASAPWFVPDRHLDLEITKAVTGANDSMLGSGAVIVMDHTTNMVAAAERLVRFFAEESCGQCTPCREGTTWLDMILARMLSGAGRNADLDLLYDVSDGISIGVGWPPKQTTICPLGPSAVSPVKSLLEFFRDEAEAHVAPVGVPVSIKPMDDQRGVGVSDEQMVTITVDGEARQVPGGELLIKACEDTGTYIPRFCYHPRMNPVGMCRMCLVEVEGPRGTMLVTSCTQPVGDGMVVHTQSADRQEGTGGDPRIPAHQPPARLPRVRQGR